MTTSTIRQTARVAGIGSAAERQSAIVNALDSKTVMIGAAGVLLTAGALAVHLFLGIGNMAGSPLERIAQDVREQGPAIALQNQKARFEVGIGQSPVYLHPDYIQPGDNRASKGY